MLLARKALGIYKAFSIRSKRFFGQIMALQLDSIKVLSAVSCAASLL